MYCENKCFIDSIEILNNSILYYLPTFSDMPKCPWSNTQCCPSLSGCHLSRAWISIQKPIFNQSMDNDKRNNKCPEFTELFFFFCKT